MKVRILKSLWMVFACLSVLHPAVLAQSSGQERNLSACRNGSGSCDLSRLSAAERTQLDVAEHQRNVSDCRNGWESCDRSKLTREEAIALAIALHQHNFATCMDGWGTCDHSQLAPQEAKAVEV